MPRSAKVSPYTGKRRAVAVTRDLALAGQRMGAIFLPQKADNWKIQRIFGILIHQA